MGRKQIGFTGLAVTPPLRLPLASSYLGELEDGMNARLIRGRHLYTVQCSLACYGDTVYDHPVINGSFWLTAGEKGTGPM